MQPLDFTITVDNRGIENGSMGAQIASNLGKKATHEGSDPQWQ